MAEKGGGDLWDAGRQGMETADAVEVPIWFLKPRPRQDADSMGEEGAVGDTEGVCQITTIKRPQAAGMNLQFLNKEGIKNIEARQRRRKPSHFLSLRAHEGKSPGRGH